MIRTILFPLSQAEMTMARSATTAPKAPKMAITIAQL